MTQDFDRGGAAVRKTVGDDAGWTDADGTADTPSHGVDEETVHAYVDGRLDAETRRRVELAMQADPELGRRLQSYARFDRNLRAAFGETPDSAFGGGAPATGTDDADPDDPDDGGPPPRAR